MRLCPFCEIANNPNHTRILKTTSTCFSIADGYPVSKGHTLIIPNRHIKSFFETSANEKVELMQLLEQSKQAIDKAHQPDGYNIGINDGTSAGQTVPHLHIHLIPRYANDQKDPRGGVRWVIPEKAKYWQ